MNAEVLRIVAQVAGIGGIALIVLLYVFRDVIRKKIFPTLTKEQAYKLLRLVVILVFIVALASIGAWVLVRGVQKQDGERPQRKLVTLVDSRTREEALNELRNVLRDIKGIALDTSPVSTDWVAQCSDLARKSPSLVVVHWHALRDVKGRDDGTAEEDLLYGLDRLASDVPNVRFLVYSRLFQTGDESGNIRLIRSAVERIRKKNPGFQENLDRVMNRIRTAYWGESSTEGERAAILRLVSELTS